jgi:hypothetical protein
VDERDEWPVQVFDGVAAVSQGDVLLIEWKSGAKAARIGWVADRAREVIARSGQGIVAVQLLLPSATPPGLGEVGAVRAALPEVLGGARRLIVVPLGDSVWQALVRTVLRAGLAILGQSERIKVAPSAMAALELVAQVRSPATPDDAALRSRLDALHRVLTAGDKPPPT